MTSTGDPGVLAAEKIAEALVRRSRSSFYWAMRVLPEPKRRAMYAIYAFCRIVDDIADGPGLETEKMSRLKCWRDELDRLFNGTPTDPVAIALMHPVKAYDLKKNDFLAVIDGMERDSGSQVRITDEQDLESYCDAVACSVGRLANQVFGVGPKEGHAIAGALGQALQLTNILRDVAEDAANDRMYIPRSVLLRHGIDSDDPSIVIHHPDFSLACQDLADLALGHYETADQMLGGYERSVMRPAVMMMETYRRVLQKLQKRGWRNIDHPVRLSGAEKLMIMVRYGWLSI